VSSRLENIAPIKREPLAVEIARQLVDYLLAGGVEPGGRMPSERQLAEAFGVGRSAMREALKALTLLGLIEVRHGDGTYLKKADAALLPQVIEWGLLLGEKRTMDLVEARQEIEVVVARLAAQRRSDRDLAALRDPMRRMAAAEASHAEFVDADVAFHLRLAEATGNTALREIVSGIQALLRAWIGRVIEAAGTTERSYQEHVPIFEAVERGDAEGAAAAMRQHMHQARGRLEQALASAAADRVGALGDADDGAA
jgi:GntR family transcriptional regulator, transcriptional repressor for pyruvate dehydrogenase complex